MSIELVMPSNHLFLSCPFSSCPQSFPTWGSFQMSQLFEIGGQSIGASSSTSVLPMNIQGWFPLGLTDLISLQSRGLSRVFSNITVWKHQFLGAQPSLWSNSHIHMWLLEKRELWPIRYKRFLLDPPENMQVNIMPGVLGPGRNVVLKLMQPSCPDLRFENEVPSHLLNGPNREKYESGKANWVPQPNPPWNKY